MLSRSDIRLLRDAGFYKSEIKRLHYATHYPEGTPQMVNIHSPAWQTTIESRRRFMDKKLDEGWTRGEIWRRAIWRFYKGYADPFLFLKLEYRPVVRIKGELVEGKPTPFQEALKRRAAQKAKGYIPRKSPYYGTRGRGTRRR